jgi:7-carboxy-7-deazaguanine synthase
VIYTVKEMYYTLQGEGAQTGRPAVFVRFAGCNLWTGREADRASAVCTFCDTDFVGVGPDGGRFATAAALADAVASLWPVGPVGARMVARPGTTNTADAANMPGATNRHGTPGPYVVCTGGEPLLQLDSDAIDALHERGFEVGVETNGTQTAPDGLDWVCVSPKAEAPVVLTRGDELKLVYPQATAPPERFARFDFRHFFLQPMDGPKLDANTRAAVAYCLAHPQWRLSLQTHKLVGLR